MKKFLSLVVVLLMAFTAKSQMATVESPQKNLVKFNVTSLLLNNYMIQYERVLSKRFSVALSYRFMPEGNLPFKSNILNLIGDDNDETAENIVNNMLLKNMAITPEVRFYVGKRGYGRGFYIAPFYRYAKFDAKNVRLTYDMEFAGSGSLDLSGDLKSNTFGVMFGAQWPLGKYFAIDWWILGPHIGFGSGHFNGLSSQPLGVFEQNEIRRELEDLDIPFADKTVEVNSTGAKVTLDGMWGGVRGGLSLVFKF